MREGPGSAGGDAAAVGRHDGSDGGLEGVKRDGPGVDHGEVCLMMSKACSPPPSSVKLKYCAWRLRSMSTNDAVLNYGAPILERFCEPRETAQT